MALDYADRAEIKKMVTEAVAALKAELGRIADLQNSGKLDVRRVGRVERPNASTLQSADNCCNGCD